MLFLMLCCRLHGPVACLAHSLQKESGRIPSNWQQPMTSPARHVIGLLIDDTAEAADGERGNPSHIRSH